MFKSIVKLIIYIAIGAAIGSGLVFYTLRPAQQNQGAAVNQQVFFSGVTNGTSTINVTPTTVFSSSAYNLFARISNPNPSTISCYLEATTSTSSTLIAGAGTNIGAASTTFSGQNSVCFGYAEGCIPYIGKVNCVSAVTTTVGVTYK